jgi:hypothetical protein
MGVAAGVGVTVGKGVTSVVGLGAAVGKAVVDRVEVGLAVAPAPTVGSAGLLSLEQAAKTSIVATAMARKGSNRARYRFNSTPACGRVSSLVRTECYHRFASNPL